MSLIQLIRIRVIYIQLQVRACTSMYELGVEPGAIRVARVQFYSQTATNSHKKQIALRAPTYSASLRTRSTTRSTKLKPRALPSALPLALPPRVRPCGVRVEAETRRDVAVPHGVDVVVGPQPPVVG